MATSLQCLLRLPSCLRRLHFLKAVSQGRAEFHVLLNNVTTRRTFQSSLRNYSQAQPTLQAARRHPGRRVPPSRTPPGPRTPGAVPVKLSYAEKLFAIGDEVLLYKAPRHRSFYISSYILGGALLIGAFNYAAISLKDPEGGRRLRWYVVVMLSVPVFFLVVVGTAFILAPTRMLRSISVLSPAVTESGRPVLRCHVKNSIPFLKRKPIEVQPTEAFLDRQVSAQDIDFTSVPIKDATTFTNSQKPYASPHPRGGGVWSSIRRDTRRMFLREGFAYLRFEGGGNWKLDLNGCEMLDWGRPLEGLTMEDLQKGVGVVAMLKRYTLSR